MPHLLFGSFSSLKVIDEFPRLIGIGSWLYHLVLLNSQYSSLEAALDQAGLIDLYFSCFSRSLSVKELSSAFDLPLWMQPVEALGELV